MNILPHEYFERIITRLISERRMKLITDILTGPDNKSYDNGRVICLASFIVYFFLAIFAAVTGHAWGPLEFAGGAAAMAAGFGANLHLKSDTEPKPSDTTINHALTDPIYNQVDAHH